MNGLFHRLAARAFGNAPVAEPIVPSVFAPGARMGQMEMDVERTEPASRSAAQVFASPTPPKTPTVPFHEPVQTSVPEKDSPVALEHRQTPEPDSKRFAQPPTLQPKRALQAGLSATDPRRAVPQVPILLAGQTAPAEESEKQLAGQSPAPVTRDVTKSVLSEARRVNREMPPIEASSQETVIRVSIGRIDVRAEMPAPAVALAPRQRTPGMSLDDYAKRRAEGR